MVRGRYAIYRYFRAARCPTHGSRSWFRSAELYLRRFRQVGGLSASVVLDPLIPAGPSGDQSAPSPGISGHPQAWGSGHQGGPSSSSTASTSGGVEVFQVLPARPIVPAHHRGSPLVSAQVRVGPVFVSPLCRREAGSSLPLRRGPTQRRREAEAASVQPRSHGCDDCFISRSRAASHQLLRPGPVGSVSSQERRGGPTGVSPAYREPKLGPQQEAAPPCCFVVRREGGRRPPAGRVGRSARAGRDCPNSGVRPQPRLSAPLQRVHRPAARPSGPARAAAALFRQCRTPGGRSSPRRSRRLHSSCSAYEEHYVPLHPL
ncbi:hypothetical protein NDU88_007423 [Pleurodeles waltl]|uniref:Uncharacterized protein n=1 Tax=Pleurodeles waltl TaxID=8319 RepID=A0AAV7NWM2_PLEWA|nr:hypothetical protein NDU88_007423 [Pleurodeles waltl]